VQVMRCPEQDNTSDLQRYVGAGGFEPPTSSASRNSAALRLPCRNRKTAGQEAFTQPNRANLDGSTAAGPCPVVDQDGLPTSFQNRVSEFESSRGHGHGQEVATEPRWLCLRRTVEARARPDPPRCPTVSRGSDCLVVHPRSHPLDCGSRRGQHAQLRTRVATVGPRPGTNVRDRIGTRRRLGAASPKPASGAYIDW
jgi:hypothetical protein